MNFMNLPEKYAQGEFVILPISYEKHVTYGGGASKGPAAIVAASKHLEYYDDQFDCEPFEKGIRLLDELKLNEKTPEEMVDVVSKEVSKHKEKFVIGLGGDHAVTIGVVRGLEQSHEVFSVVQFDAHADFRNSWNGSALNHACIARQISKKHELLQIGIRSMDVDEKELLEGAENVHVIKAYDFSLDKVRELLPKLKDRVFITIDVDVFDPSFLRNTGTPEPGGLLWNDVVNCLKLIFENKTVIGADITEFAPKGNYDAEAYALAKFVYKIMAMKVTYETKV